MPRGPAPLLPTLLLGLLGACAAAPAPLADRLPVGETRLLRSAESAEILLLRLEPDQTGWIARLPAGRPVEEAGIRRIAHWWPAADGEICHLSRRLAPDPAPGTDLDCIRPAPDGRIRIGHRLWRDHGGAPIVVLQADGAAPALQGALPAR